ncbi:MAG: SurA N-terminal domain-containing protein [Bacteroidota bacterium]|jgi:peptidyl-prolyl cis-trans isomerase D
MSNKKNAQPVEKNEEKDNMSILESIRKRTGLLVGIVGLALVIFILQSLLGSGASIFGGSDETTVGKINGTKIDRNEFAAKVENQLNMIRQNRQTQDVDDATRGQVVDYVWNQYINDLIIKPQYDKLGIMVGDDEKYQKVVMEPMPFIIQQISDPQTGQLNPNFAKADGSFDPNKWKQAIQSVTGDQELAVLQMEDQVVQMRMGEKYISLIKKGMYVTSAEAKAVMANNTTQANISYVMKPYTLVSDSAVSVTDSDIQKYYNEHIYEFYNPETTRSLEYVTYNVLASEKDLAAVESDAKRAAEDFKTKSIKEDSAFIQAESENGVVTIQDFTKKTMIIRDSSIYTAPVGSVFGPYNEGAYFKIYKLQGIKSIADSAKVRHILIGTQPDPKTQQPTRSIADCKRIADSLIGLIKTKKVSFDTLVKTVSDDQGSKTNGGDYGWFDENKQFVEPFKMAGLMGTKGNISPVETQFGVHIIEVLDVSKTRHNTYKLAQIFKLIAPSDETNQMIFAKASEFAGKNNTGELFDKGIETEKLTKRIADNLKESDRSIVGLDNAREIVRWAYTAKKGEINVFSLTDKHVVVKLATINTKGTKPLEDVKDEVKAKAIVAKKAEQFLKEFAAAGTSVSQIATKLNLNETTMEDFNLSNRNIKGAGIDNVLSGTIAGLKSGTTSKPIAGDNGVFVVQIVSKKQNPSQTDETSVKRQLEAMYSNKADQSSFTALQEMTDIEDHKGRIE